MAELKFKYGNMASGKSLHLLSTAHQFKINGIKYKLLKSSIDTRDNGVISSRIGIEEPCVTINPCDNIWSLIQPLTTSNVKWILVDEAQFLTTSQIDELAYLVDKYDINVICYGLRTDYQTHLFEGSKRLFEIADSFEELLSYCECGTKNSVNTRIDNNGDIDFTDCNQIEIGGDSRYKSMCRRCYTTKTIRHNYLAEEIDE